MIDYYTLSELDPEEYEKLMKIAFDYMLDFYQNHMGADTFIPIVKDHPQQLEEQLNIMQSYLNHIHKYAPTTEAWVLATMHVTQAAFMLGYLTARDTEDTVPDVFKSVLE